MNNLNHLISMKSCIFRAVDLDDLFIFRHVKKIRKIFYILFALSFALFLFTFLDLIDVSFSSIKILGVSFLMLGFVLIFLQLDLFFNLKLKHPKILNKKSDGFKEFTLEEISEFFSFKIARAYKDAARSGKNNPCSMFLYYLMNDSDFEFIFSRAGLSLSSFREQIKELPDKDENQLSCLIRDSFNETRKRNGKRIKKNDVLVVACKTNNFIKKFFSEVGIKNEDIRNLALWVYRFRKENSDKKKFWKWKNLIKKGSLAKDWAAGYTVILNNFSVDITEKLKREGFPNLIGHKERVKSIERILASNEKNNVILVGDRGTGRRNMIYEIARKSFYGETLPEINYQRIVGFDLPYLLANVSDYEEIEKIIDKIFQEVSDSGNTIIVINNIHDFLIPTAGIGRIDISGAIAPYLSLPQFKIIGVTDYAGYRKIEERTSMAVYFEKIEVNEISKQETLILLQNISVFLENKYRKIISYQSIREIVDFCDKYLPSEPFPTKAINVLDESMVYLNQINEPILKPSHVSEIISRKTNIPVGSIKESEKEKLLDLENLIHKRVVNQEEAIKSVASALRRSRAQISSDQKPMGSFLFLGPTGVGKTETAKALAEVYFDSSEQITRIDMSEFQSVTDIYRLIGSPDTDGLLTTKVRENPFCLVLLDEIEKAHPDILNIFLQVLDDGHITDGKGRVVSFKNSIIIATSNAGSDMILNNIKENNDWHTLKEKLLNSLFNQNVFRPEFINRFDSVALFSPLSKKHLLEITGLILNKISKNLEKQNIELIVTEELKERIVEIGYDPKFGAREIKRAIQDNVENSIASALISNKIYSGCRIKINPEDFGVEII